MIPDPPDVDVVIEPSFPIKAIEKSNVLLECNVTSGNPSNLQKVMRKFRFYVINFYFIYKKCLKGTVVSGW